MPPAATRAAVSAERGVFAGLGGGCSLPLGTRARSQGGGWNVAGELWGQAGERAFDEREGADAAQVAAQVAVTLLASGLVPESEG